MKPRISSGALALLSAFMLLPGLLQGQGKPARSADRFRLFARAGAEIAVNSVSCGIEATGQLCVNSTGISTIGGGFWPRNSPQQYMFNSGVQVAGSIDSTAGFAWAGDTTGAFFFDPKGTTQHGQQVEPVWNYSDPADRANWPEAAKVPAGDPSAAFFDPSLQGRPSASEGDLWTLAWDGDPAQNAGRTHPLGVALETRVLAWNGPSGNQDVLYFVFTLHNISSSCAADYAAVRPGMREELLTLGQRFRSLNQAKFPIQIPVCGYGIKGLYFGISADPDVSSSAGSNYSSVALPFKMGYAYQANFQSPDNHYVLPDAIGGPPFINGYGFVGIQYLKTPIVAGNEVGLKMFSVTVGGGSFGDPGTVRALFRYLSGTQSPGLGDGNCNYVPFTQHVCYVKADGPADMRFYESTGPVDIPPGGSATIAMAYLFASAVAIPSCSAADCPTVTPRSATLLTRADSLATTGASPLDSLTGFAGYADLNGDGVVQANEFRTVRGSLFGKAQMAQVIFDNGFVVPTAPDAPDFFLVPGHDQVTILWRPSATERTGDAFSRLASMPGQHASLYDPNFRRYDVEGYRIYRGRVDAPSTMTLVAQFDYAGHDSYGHDLVFQDHLGAMSTLPGCAPELGRRLIADGCDIDFDPTPAPGQAYHAHADHPIVGPFIQVKLGDRFLKADGTPFVVVADTAVTGGRSGLQDLWDTGVPFVYVDATAKDNLRYFYTVTTFDVNSIQSGRSSLESPRVTKPVMPTAPSPNHRSVVQTSVGVRGRGVLHDPTAVLPTLDPTTGEFSGPMPAADGAQLGVVGDFVSEVVDGSGEFFAKLDSLRLGQVDLSGCCMSGGAGMMAHYYWTVSDGRTSTMVDLPIQQDFFSYSLLGASRVFNAIRVDPRLGREYGGSGQFEIQGELHTQLQPIGFAGASGLGAALGEPGLNSFDFAAVGTSGVHYDGFRWYSGSNEATADPTSPGSCGFSTQPCPASPGLTNFNNAGAISGATLVYMPHAYRGINREWRNAEAVLGGAVRAADIRVYWGAPGVVDSVIDLTHNVPLTYADTLGGGWAILNTVNTGAGSQDLRPGVLTPADWMCIEPFFSLIPGSQGFFPCTTLRHTSQTAVLGAIAPGAGDNQVTTNANSWKAPGNLVNGGFSMYVSGTITFFGGLATLPTATTWTLRSYSGAIFGGKGSSAANGNPGILGPYTFVSKSRPMTAVGAEVVYQYSVAQVATHATQGDLSRVHTVPDPYYVTNGFETDPAHKVIKFVNLPSKAIIRIYSVSGVLVRVLEHNSGVNSGAEDWDVRNSGGRLVANGVYFYALESGEARRVGRMTIVTLGR